MSVLYLHLHGHEAEETGIASDAGCALRLVFPLRVGRTTVLATGSLHGALVLEATYRKAPLDV